MLDYSPDEVARFRAWMKLNNVTVSTKGNPGMPNHYNHFTGWPNEIRLLKEKFATRDEAVQYGIHALFPLLDMAGKFFQEYDGPKAILPSDGVDAEGSTVTDDEVRIAFSAFYAFEQNKEKLERYWKVEAPWIRVALECVDRHRAGAKKDGADSV